MDENKDLEQVESTEETPAETEKSTDKKKNITTVIICAAVVIIAVIVAVCILNSGKNKPAENGSDTTTQPVSYETVTDENGEVVTDASGNEVTQAVSTTQGASNADNGGSNGNSGGNSGGGSQGSSEVTERETTTSKKAEKRKLKIYVVTPLESGETDTAVVYVNGEEDCRIEVALDGKNYFAETSKKYKGDADVEVVLETYGTSWKMTVGGLYDTQTFVMPLSHSEEGIVDFD